ncbi:hypothetical protein LEN26_017143 [Aphanomyces euteiches]|nr:hypothetical protein LEN26_017143 [Aphanomyces euteiches]
MLKNGPISWTLESAQDDFRHFKGVEPAQYGKSNSSGLFCSTLTINGTLEEVIEHFHIDTTEKAQEVIQRIGHGALDSINLASLPPPSNSPLESVFVMWIAGKMAFDGHSRRRDKCVVECGYRFEVNGRRGWVRATKSVKMDSCPDLEATMGYVLRKTEALVMFSSNLIDQAVFRQFKSIKKICSIIKDVDRLLREDRLSRGSWMSPRHYVSQDSVDSCHRCHSTFSSFRKKTNCQKCGKVVWSSSNLSWQVKVNDRVTKMNACGVCSLRPPRKAKKEVDDDVDNAPWLSESFLSPTQTTASIYIEIAAGHDNEDGFYYQDHRRTIGSVKFVSEWLHLKRPE